MNGTTGGRLAALAAAALALAAPSCTEERTLSADEFVADVNEQGIVRLTLGEMLHTEDESKELYAVTLEPLETEKAAGQEEEHGHEHGGGSLAVYESTDGAEEGLKACRAAADLLCYRASNVVVIIQGGGVETQQLGLAIRRLAE